jgi:hypothetical protein
MKTLNISLKFINGLRKNKKQFVADMIEKYGTNFVVKTPFTNLHFFADPKYVESVLYDKNAKYVRPPNIISDPTFTDSSLSDVRVQETWRKERFKTVNALMAENAVKKHTDVIINSTKTMLDN